MKKTKKVKKIKSELIPPKDGSNSGSSTKQIVVRERRMAWKGPLPHPEVLNEYNGAVKNGAERIVSAWERESSHRQAIEKHRQTREDRALLWAIIDSFFGKTLSFLYVVLVLLLSMYAFSEKFPWHAVILGGSTIGAAVLAFIKMYVKGEDES